MLFTVKKTKTICLLFLLVAMMILFIFTMGCRQVDETENYISDCNAFMQALQKGQSPIYINNISFDEQTEISLNYPVQIIGKEDKSIVENAHFVILGTNVPDQTISVIMKNIIFDGKADRSLLTLEEGKTFSEIIGDLPQYHCINGSVGYYDLTIENCEICRYLCEDGPAVYINNDVNYRNGKRSFNLINTKIYDNTSNIGTVKVFSDILTTNIDGCDFFGNLARAGQGICVGNGRSMIVNTDVHDNDFFHFVYYMEKKFPAIFHDDKQTFKGITTNALGACCGAIFIGGSNAMVNHCRIFNNKTIYGGGIGIINSSTLIADEKIEIMNTEIRNNTALLCGGGIYIESNQGETTYFTNCSIIGNHAGEKGSILYTTTYSPDSNTSYGGNVQFAFCTMAENTAEEDTDTFGYYDLLDEKLAGQISLKGCFVLDGGSYIEDGNEYNYMATKNEALESGVLSEKDFENPDINELIPQKGSAGDIHVPASVCATWQNGYDVESRYRRIGYISSTTEQNILLYWILILLVSVIGTVVGIAFSKKKKSTVPVVETIGGGNDSIITKSNEIVTDYAQYPFEDVHAKVSMVWGETLTKKEIEVATYLLYEMSRKEIADRLFISDETVKTHLSNIFKKVGVSSKVEFKKITDNLISRGM